MPEKIYTIPVNEAFEASRDDASCGCPFCTLYNTLEENELDRILGAAMMEPDVRIETNAQGFCDTHFKMMFVRKNRLGMGLILESHLAEIAKGQKNKALSLKAPGTDQEAKLEKLEGSCYVCGRIAFAFGKMMDTAAYLWENEKEFRDKCAAQPYFCLPHYRAFVAQARRSMNKKTFASFWEQVSGIENAYLEKIGNDVSWFCKKFVYRYNDEPWYDSKDAVERAMKFLSGDLHKDPKKVQS